MQRYTDILWTAFESTGGVRAYLKYRLLLAEKTKVGVGEKFGIDKNLGDCDQNHQIR